MPFPPSLPPANSNSPFADLEGNHVALRVPDFDASKRWFVEKLDFRVIHEWASGDRRLAYMAPPNDDKFWVEILGDGTPPPMAKPGYVNVGDSLGYAGYHHFCLRVANVDLTVAELRRRGVAIVSEPFTLEVIRRKLAFVADPWGNLVELAEILS